MVKDNLNLIINKIEDLIVFMEIFFQFKKKEFYELTYLYNLL